MNYFFFVALLVVVSELTDHTITVKAFQSYSRSIKITRNHRLVKDKNKTPFPSRFHSTSLVLRISSGGGELSESSKENDANMKSRCLLCLVALLYGTLNVSLRLVYQLEAPPSAATLSCTRGLLASLCFVPLLAMDRTKGKEVSPISSSSKKGITKLLLAGTELAMWNFFAQALLNVGLLSTGSARASFLTQASVILTPMISLIAGQSVSSSVWFGCGVALCGLTLLSGGLGSATIAFSTGDYFVLGGALSWSFYLFRLSKIGSNFNAINLQAVKTNVLAVFYSIWFGFSVFQQPVSWVWASSMTVWVALFYSALVSFLVC
jgi:drug/metabolite transporter (DMT)-like permease